ncbi:CLUMA_CG017377, isoform A [Clunio marinus]|uniref:CLUMA_CG017377, isoform A n=1 Tax=Clunio marinus TaxID=568069 RepID=A0A1J1IVS5_9DIPT|nr:CLUMA_CG017377, isoform A [Clunio marinus]
MDSGMSVNNLNTFERRLDPEKNKVDEISYQERFSHRIRRHGEEELKGAHKNIYYASLPIKLP